MALHKLPHENMAASSWLALGPIGTVHWHAAGCDAPAIFAANGLPGIGEIAAGLGWLPGSPCGASAVVDVDGCADHSCALPAWHHPNLGWWGFTFPLGVYSLATLKLASTCTWVFSVFGCVLVSVAGSDVADRRQTHRAGRLAR
jgi:hypothetical protein